MVWENLARLSAESEGSGGIEGVLMHADGKSVVCVMALTPISFGGNAGFILLAKEVIARVDPETGGEDHLRKMAQVAQSASIGLFRANVMRRALFLEMNTAASTLAYTARPDDMHQLSLADLFHDTAEYEEFRQKLFQENMIQDYLLRIDTSNAGTCALSLSANLIRDEQGHPNYIDGMIKDITEVKKIEADREALIEKLQTSLLFLNEPVGHFRRHTVVCGLETPIGKVADLMTKRDSSAVLVETESGAVVGIVTDHDLRQRVVAEGVDTLVPVRTVMSAPLVTMSEHALIYEALMKMEEKGVQHLPLEDETGRIVGIIKNKELIQFHRYGLYVLTHEISRSKTPAEVVRCCERVPSLVKALVECGARSRNITHIISTICDAAVERFVVMAFVELGEPPVEFAFIAMGSHGRMEQTLLTDQDNAIIYLDQEDPAAKKRVGEYFLRLGAKVCDWLVQAGYSRCQGQVMASNPRWCCSLGDWKRYFSEWINKAEPQELLDFIIFFDFRAVYGKAEMVHELRHHVYEILEENPSFFIHMAQNSLQIPTPFKIFGKIFPLGGLADQPGQLNMKDTMMSIVNFARLYALNHKVNPTHTLDRIDALVEKNVLLQSSGEEINISYEFLMRLRLQHQIHAFQNGNPIDNIINPDKLGHMEEALLKQAFTQISAVQKKISYDFLGGTT
jgi:CBS domain-containing protein